MALGFQRLTGEQDVRTLLVDTAAVVAIGDLVSTDESAGDLIVGASNIANVGVALEASAATETAAIRYDRLTPGSIWRARVETGTMAITEKGKFADINTQDGITLTESNNDCRIIDWDGVAGFADVEFTTTEQLGPTTV
jgi:hypothetical protein